MPAGMSLRSYPYIERCLSALLILSLIGPGWLLRGVHTALSADPHACCKSGQHCPISYGPQAHGTPHTRDCPHTRQKAAPSLGCALRTCHPSGPTAQPSADASRFVFTRPVRLSITPTQQPHRPSAFTRPTDIALIPPTPPPRSPFVV